MEVRSLRQVNNLIDLTDEFRKNSPVFSFGKINGDIQDRKKQKRKQIVEQILRLLEGENIEENVTVKDILQKKPKFGKTLSRDFLRHIKPEKENNDDDDDNLSKTVPIESIKDTSYFQLEDDGKEKDRKNGNSKKSNFAPKNEVKVIKHNLLTPTWIKQVLRSGYILAINIQAENDKKLFAEGIYYGGKMCESSSTNHAVAIIGFNDADIHGEGYWLVKDSSVDSLGRTSEEDDHMISKLYWRENFFSSKGGLCFCGGEGSECMGSIFTRDEKFNFKPF